MSVGHRLTGVIPRRVHGPPPGARRGLRRDRCPRDLEPGPFLSTVPPRGGRGGSQFAGEPQCFLTEPELVAELVSAGFDALGPLTEYNQPAPGQLNQGGPVIYEGTFRLRV